MLELESLSCRLSLVTCDETRDSGHIGELWPLEAGKLGVIVT